MHKHAYRPQVTAYRMIRPGTLGLQVLTHTDVQLMLLCVAVVMVI